MIFDGKQQNSGKWHDLGFEAAEQWQVLWSGACRSREASRFKSCYELN
jgi:hypothetical protein